MQDVDPRFLRQRAAEVLATRVPALVPVRKIQRRGNEVLIVSDDDDAVSLARLLDRAKPSLTEAAALAATVLEAVAGMHDAGQAHGDLTAAAVRVGVDGSARLAGWAVNALLPAGLHEDVRKTDVRAAAGLVTDIAKAAGRPTRPLTDREERIVARLASAGDPRRLTRRNVLKAAHGLDTAIGPLERRRAAHQGVISLAAAVAALDAPLAAAGRHGGAAAVTDGEGFDPADDPLEILDEVPEVIDDRPPVVDRPPVIVAEGGPAGGSGPGGDELFSAGLASPGAGTARRPIPPPARRPPIWPRVWKGAAVAAVVALILGVELRFFGDKVSRNVHVLLSGDVKGAAAAPGPRRPGPMPVLGPAAAGPVTHLELRPLDTCKPAAPCTAVVQVTVAPAPHDRPLDVAYGLEVVDRCRSGRESRPGGVLSVPPGQDRAVQTVSLPLPEGRALAVIPLTTSPVAVAGTPLRLPGDDGPC